MIRSHCIVNCHCELPHWNIDEEVDLYSGSLLVQFPSIRESRRDPCYCDHYIKTHMRIGPYTVSVLAGVLFYALINDHKGSTWRLSKVLSPNFLNLASYKVRIV